MPTTAALPERIHKMPRILPGREGVDSSMPLYTLRIGSAIVFFGATAASSVLFALTLQTPSSFLFLILAASLTVFLRLAVHSPWVYLAALPALIAGFLTGGAFTAAASLLWLPLAAAISICILRGQNKKQVTLVSVFTLLAAACLWFAIWFAFSYGSLSPALLRDTFSGWYDRLRATMFPSASIDLLYEYLAPSLNGSLSLDAFRAQMSALADAFFLSLKMMTPAIIGLLAILSSNLSVSLAALWIKIMNCPLLIPCRPFTVNVSPIAASVYVLAYFASSAASLAEETRIALGINNVVLLFMPAMLLMGGKCLLRLAKNPLRRRIFLLSALFLLLFIWNGLSWYLVSLLGVVDCFRSAYRNKVNRS